MVTTPEAQMLVITREDIEKARSGASDSHLKIRTACQPAITCWTNHYLKRSMHQREDLEMAGEFAVLNAIVKYTPDHDSKSKFTTYAYPGIRRAIRDESWNLTGVIGGSHLYRKYRDAIRALTTSLGREPDLDEIASHLKIDAVNLKAFLQARATVPIDKLEERADAGWRASARDGMEKRYCRGVAREVVRKASAAIPDTVSKLLFDYESGLLEETGINSELDLYDYICRHGIANLTYSSLRKKKQRLKERGERHQTADQFPTVLLENPHYLLESTIPEFDDIPVEDDACTCYTEEDTVFADVAEVIGASIIDVRHHYRIDAWCGSPVMKIARILMHLYQGLVLRNGVEWTVKDPIDATVWKRLDDVLSHYLQHGLAQQQLIQLLLTGLAILDARTQLPFQELDRVYAPLAKGMQVDPAAVRNALATLYCHTAAFREAIHTALCSRLLGAGTQPEISNTGQPGLDSLPITLPAAVIRCEACQMTAALVERGWTRAEILAVL